MKNYLKISIILFFVSLSFYLTEKVIIFSINKNPIMTEIKMNKSKYKIESVNAIISDNTVIPGIKGLEVNEIKSFNNMKKIGYYDEEYLVYDYLVPENSIKDAEGKLIISGNPNKNNISIIIDNNLLVKDYSINNALLVNVLIEVNDFDKSSILEQINKNSDSNVESLLNTNKLNKYICINRYECNNKYMVKPTKELTKTNILDIKQSLNYGDIILINQNASLADYKLLINDINYRGINIVYLSELISE